MTRWGHAFKPGDPPPAGYIARQSWAAVQHAAGLEQVRCERCDLWQFPQELSREDPPLCHECAAALGQPAPAEVR